MRYILYILTLALVFSAGMMVGNTYLPEHGVSLATAVSAPDLDAKNPILSATDRANAEKELALISDALQICPMVVNADKDVLINHIKLWLALEDFQIKRAHLETEITKNNVSNRPTRQFVQATSEYNDARAKVEKLADELFPTTQEIFINPTQITTLISSHTATAPITVKPVAPITENIPSADSAQPKAAENTVEQTQPAKADNNKAEQKAETAATEPKTEDKKTEVKTEEKKTAEPKAEEKKAEVKAEENKAAEKKVDAKSNDKKSTAQAAKAETKAEQKAEEKKPEMKAEPKPEAKTEVKPAETAPSTNATPAEPKAEEPKA